MLQPAASAAARAAAPPWWNATMWSSRAPDALCPPSLNHMPGSTTLWYGPHTPGTSRTVGESAMWQLDVPRMSASREKIASAPLSRLPRASGAPSTPTTPAWASIDPAATAVPGRRPSSAAAAVPRPAPTACPGGSICALLIYHQMRANGEHGMSTEAKGVGAVVYCQ